METLNPADPADRPSWRGAGFVRHDLFILGALLLPLLLYLVFALRARPAEDPASGSSS